jgi:arylsulfatase A-like enzyme
MNRREFLGALGATPLISASRPPNIIVVLGDDLGAKELGCYGNTKHRTPNLDELARTGVKFDTCYATPICHPTRVEILTGQYGARNGVYNFAGRRGGPDADSPVEDIGKNHETFAEMLKAKGYATGIVGKWQLSGKQPDLIYECGFDDYCMWAYQNYLAPEDLPKFKNRERYWQPAIIRNRKFIETTINDYGPDIFNDHAIEFIRKNRQRPFLLYYCSVLTHGPHCPTPDSVKSDAEKHVNSKDNFKADVEYLDKLMGKLLKALDDNGLRKDTIFIFTADNGTGGEGKGTGTELGARVPMIVNCPGRVKQRGASEELTDLSDILPTLAEFAGAELPKGKVLDGKSMAGYLRGDSAAPREWIFSFIGDRRIVRTKRYLLDDNSPLHYGKLYECGMSRDGTGYKDVTNSDAPEVKAIKAEFEQILVANPAPYVPYEGPAAAMKSDGEKGKKNREGKRRNKQ